MSLLLLFNGGQGAFIPAAPVGGGGRRYVVRRRRLRPVRSAEPVVETLAALVAPVPVQRPLPKVRIVVGPSTLVADDELALLLAVDLWLMN